MHNRVAVCLELTDATLDNIAFSAFVQESDAHGPDFGHDVIQACLFSEKEDQIGGTVKAEK